VVSVSVVCLRSDQVLTILVSIYFEVIIVEIPIMSSLVGVLATTPTTEASSLVSTILLATLVLKVLGSLSDS
jgi:hypothetical protein